MSVGTNIKQKRESAVIMQAELAGLSGITQAMPDRKRNKKSFAPGKCRTCCSARMQCRGLY